MRVAIDISPISNASRYRGMGFYTKRLLEHLLPVAKSHGIDIVETNSIKKTSFNDIDLIHITHFSPYAVTIPQKRMKTVITVHDLIPLMYPDKFPVGIRGKIGWYVQQKRLRSSDAIITDSEFWRSQISRMVSYPLEGIFNIPLAAGDEFAKVNKKSILDNVSGKFSLPEKYLLYVGDINWNKNVLGLIRSFSKITKVIKDLKLVLIGKAFFGEEIPELIQIKKLINELHLGESIKILGFVETQDLVSIYSMAQVFCYPSFCEGFGLPVLEAMKCACPVVAGNNSSLREICGGAAIMVQPESINDIASGIIEAARRRKTLIAKGLRQSSKYNWDKTARETISVYKKIVTA